VAQTLSNLVTHVVFSTRERRAIIARDVMPELHSYVGGIVRNLGGKALAVGGIADHVHVLMRLPPSVSISDAVRTIKARSSHWMHEQEGSALFAWQAGYGAFSVSRSNVQAVARYIANQAIHHRNQSFEHEYLETLRLNDVEYDERYIWT